MKFLAAVLRTIFILLALLFTMAVMGVVLVAGSIYYLLSGRKPQVRVFRAGRNPRDMFQSAPPPMKDVTPRDVTPDHHLSDKNSF